MNRFLPILLILWLLPTVSQAQLRGGFKTGLNFSSLKGPVLSEDGGTETFEPSTGFHVGPVIQLPITESFGVKAEILYNQAGGKYHFDGNGFNIFRAEDGTKILATGQKKIDLRLLNTYIDVPILAYGRVGAFQVEGGLRLGFLVSSTADGKLTFSGKTELGTPVAEQEQTLFYNYKKDKAGEANYSEVTQILLDGKKVEIPSKLGAYFFEDKKEKFFNTFDLGLSVGASYFIGRSLYVGARANFGLSDVTNNKADFNQIKTDGLNLIRQADKDKNFQIQLSVGFSL